VTKSVTPTDSLVLSPLDWPEGPEAVPDVHDAFARAVVGLREGRVGFCWDGGQPLIAHEEAPELMFRIATLLRDGATAPYMVPDAWQGKITREIVASYFATEWLLYQCEPGWGAHASFGEIREAGDGIDVHTSLPAKLPLVDPLRDTAGVDDESYLPLVPVKAGEWGSLLTPWENVDGLLATHTPGQAWLDRRTAQAMVPSDRWWWEVRGWRDGGDGHRYEDMERHPISVTVYLGWPAYVIAAAGKTTRCPQCGGARIQGRQFCRAPECDRARAAERKRVSRAGAEAHPPSAALPRRPTRTSH
jgi:hypothetical protein